MKGSVEPRLSDSRPMAASSSPLTSTKRSWTSWRRRKFQVGNAVVPPKAFYKLCFKLFTWCICLEKFLFLSINIHHSRKRQDSHPKTWRYEERGHRKACKGHARSRHSLQLCRVSSYASEFLVNKFPLSTQCIVKKKFAWNLTVAIRSTKEAKIWSEKALRRIHFPQNRATTFIPKPLTSHQSLFTCSVEPLHACPWD